ncbi:MAG: potassium channel family protein [Desulfobacterales bacterium]
MRSRFLLYVLPILVMISTFGIYFIEGYGDSPYTNLFDSLWWTIVTFTTVGYGDLSPATIEGKLFGMLILVFGVIINSIIISIIANWFFTFQSSKAQGRKAVKMKDHVLICSDDPAFVTSLVYESKEYVEDHKLIIIWPFDRHPLVGTPLEKIRWISGLASHKEVLKKASGENSKIAYVSYKDDSFTVMAVMQLENMTAGVVLTMARYSSHQDYRIHLDNVGCDYAVRPFDIYAPLMVQAFYSQGAPEWIREVIMSNENSPTLKNRTLQERYANRQWLSYIREMKRTSSEMPLGIIENEGQIIINPPYDYLLSTKSRILSLTPAASRNRGDQLSDAMPISGIASINTKGHILICSDQRPFINRLLNEIKKAHIKDEIVVIANMPISRLYHEMPNVKWLETSSFSEEGFTQAGAQHAKVALVDHKQDSHTLMAVLRLEIITKGAVFSVASYRESGFDAQLIQAGCDVCLNVDELVAPILSQTANHFGLGFLVEEMISRDDHSQSLFVRTLNDSWKTCKWDVVIEGFIKEYGFLPVGFIKRKEEKMVVNPDMNCEVEVGDTIIFITRADTKIEASCFA